MLKGTNNFFVVPMYLIFYLTLVNIINKKFRRLLFESIYYNAAYVQTIGQQNNHKYYFLFYLISFNKFSSFKMTFVHEIAYWSNIKFFFLCLRRRRLSKMYLPNSFVIWCVMFRTALKFSSRQSFLSERIFLFYNIRMWKLS